MLKLVLALNVIHFFLGEAVQAIDDLVDESIGEAEGLLDRQEVRKAFLIGGTELLHERRREAAADAALVLA